MKRLFFLFLLSALPTLLYAETVMLFTRMQPPESQTGANIERFIAVEDGVEDQFYSSGHIIFDAGLPGSGGQATVAHTDRWAQRSAKRGGAGYLLIVNLDFPNPKKTSTLPKRATYRFVNLKTGSLLATGAVTPDEPASGVKKKKPYDLCFALGRRIAREAMSRWRPSS